MTELTKDAQIEIALRGAKKMPSAQFSYSDKERTAKFIGGEIKASEGNLFRFFFAAGEIYYYEVPEFDLYFPSDRAGRADTPRQMREAR